MSTIIIPKVVVGNVSGPASYSAGGFTLDLSASLSSINHLDLEIETAGSLPDVEWEILCDRTAAGAVAYGQVAIKLTRPRYNKGSVSTVTGQPSGVTVQAAKTATATTTGSSHTHAIDHNHVSAQVNDEVVAGAGANAAAGQPAITEHSHNIDLPNLTGTSGAQTHTHQRSFEYAHNHANTQAATDMTLTEVANATDLSTTTFRYIAVGQADQ